MNGRLVEETRQQKLPKDYISCATACHDHIIFLVEFFAYELCILCISCICFVFVPYALTLPVSGLSFMSIKICSVLLDWK